MRTAEVGRAPLSRRSFCEGGRASARTVPPQWDALPHYHGLMFLCQHAPLDLLMFYDARIGCAMNNMFDVVSLEPMRGYYPFLAWARLRRLGTELAVSVENADGFYAVAAVGPDGHIGILVVRYTDNDNISAPQSVTIKADGRSLAKARCHLTDKQYFFSEVIPVCNEDGSITLSFKPNSFAFIEE